MVGPIGLLNQLLDFSSESGVYDLLSLLYEFRTSPYSRASSHPSHRQLVVAPVDRRQALIMPSASGFSRLTIQLLDFKIKKS